MDGNMKTNLWEISNIRGCPLGSFLGTNKQSLQEKNALTLVKNKNNKQLEENY